MRRSLRHLCTDRRGIALVTVLALMGILSVLAAAFTLSIRADVALRGGAARERAGFYAAEAGLNTAMDEVRQFFFNQTPPGNYQNTISIASGPQTRSVMYAVTPVPGRSPAPSFIIPAGQRFAGLYSEPSDYTVSSTAKNVAGDTEAALGAQFTVHSIPIFQFVAFFADDLEVQPKVDMNLHGRMHTNGSLYLNSGETLTISDNPPSMPTVQVTARGNIFRKRKDNNTCTGTVIVDTAFDGPPADGNLDPLTLNCNGGGALTNSALAAYGGSLASGVDTIEVPDPGMIDRGAGNLFWDHADLRIVLRRDLPRASIDFDDSDLCHNDSGTLQSPALYLIEVQNADGTRNENKTEKLWRFMCERRGALFYTDVPNNAAFPQNTITLGATDPSNKSNYTPAFVTNERVYRRVGEDTNGDGIVDTTINGTYTSRDRNRDICPAENSGGGGGNRPWWAMEDCPWPNPLASLPATSWFHDMDYRRGGFYNNREKKWMLLLNVNLRALLDWDEVDGNRKGPGRLIEDATNTDGGLVIYLSVQGPDSNAAANNYGVRIFDSADLNTHGSTFPMPAAADPTGLTIVSDQAIYVAGNYNSKDKYPAAVIGDSVNVLSQGWEIPSSNGLPNDRKSVATLGSNQRDVPANDGNSSGANCGGNGACAALDFAINSAFISGMDITIAGDPDGGGGGLQNYPRFHEDWEFAPLRTLTYRGSFVSLGTARHVNGKWCCNGDSDNMYNPPVRNWDYEVDYNNVSKLPPLTPRFTYLEQQLFTRFYQ